MMQISFPLDDPLFCLAFHPSEPQFVLGFVSGRVECHKYDRSSFESSEIAWEEQLFTDDSSCRALAYTLDGDRIIAAGSNSKILVLESSTGKELFSASTKAPPTCVALSMDYAAVGDEAGNLQLYRLEADGIPLHRKYRLEPAEFVSAVCWLPINKHSFACAGDMHVFRVDARKDELVSTSEDQEDDVVSGCVTSAKLSAWGLSSGVLTVWNNTGMEDQQQRIKITKEGSVDAVLAAEIDDHAVAGTSDGLVVECDLISGQVVRKGVHNQDEDVMCLDYDCCYRLVSASMSLLRVWDELPPVLKESKKKKKKLSVKEPAKKKKKSNFEKPVFEGL